MNNHTYVQCAIFDLNDNQDVAEYHDRHSYKSLPVYSLPNLFTFHHRYGILSLNSVLRDHPDPASSPDPAGSGAGAGQKN